MTAIKIACFALAATSSYAAFLIKLYRLRHSWRDHVYMTLMITLLLQCLTFSMGVTAMVSASLLGTRNLAILFMHLAAVAYCISAQVLLLQWSGPIDNMRQRIARWTFFGGCLEAVLVALFFMGGAQHKPAEALATGSSDPIILTYLLTFIVSQVIPCISILRLCLRYATMTEKPWLRRALRVLAVGQVLLFLYCLTRTINIVSPLFDVDTGGWAILPSLFSGIGIFVATVGLMMPSWEVQFDKLVAWQRNYTSYKALYPLWHALYRSTPDIALEPPTSSVSDLRYRLHRRVIEIRDGWRALRPYMDGSDSVPQPLTGGANTDDEDSQAFTEAIRLKRAIDNKSEGVPPQNERGVSEFDERDAETLAAEVSWLTRVSLAYERLG